MRRRLIAILLLSALGQASAGEQYALLVGIDQVPGIGAEFDLRFAESDVQSLRDLLLSKGFYAQENIVLLTGSALQDTVRANKNIIQGRIVDVMAKNLAPDDVLLVYLAMHGTLVREGDQTRRAFLPADASKKYASSYITDQELADWLKRVPAQKVVVLDVCFAGGKGTRSFRDEASRALLVPAFEQGDPLARSAQAVITASGRDEPARDGELARALGQALSEFARTDRDGDRRLSAREIYESLQDRVEGQHPELLPERPEVSLVDGSTGFLTIETTPPGAEVWFGGERLGETPLNRRPVKAVTDVLTVQKEGFEDYRVAALTVLPGYGNRQTFELQRRLGRISGRVVDEQGQGVPGAAVTLLGATAISATTDPEGHFELRAPFGQYSGVAARARGYREASSSEGISVDVGRPSFRLSSLLQLAREMGTLSITSAPPDAQVFLDGRLIGRTPFHQALPAGQYELRLESEGVQPWVETVAVYDQQETPREISLEQRLGTLVVRCSETDAVVYLDDQPTGRSLATLRLGYQLPVGRHTVRVTKPNFADFVAAVQVREGQTSQVQAELVRGGGYLSVRGLPEGAKLKVKPANGSALEFRGAIERQPLPAGEVVVVASAAGYEGWERRLAIRQGEEKVLRGGLAPRSRLKAGVRALALPSWGQFYGERPGRGSLVLLGALGAAGGFGYAQVQYHSVEKDYNAAIRAYNSATTLSALRRAEQEVNTAYDDLDQWHQLRRMGTFALIGIWGYGVLDALIAGPSRPAGLAVQPIPERAGAILAWRF